LRRSDYKKRFDSDFDRAYGCPTRLPLALGWVVARGDELALSDDSIYWLQDPFSIEYVGRLCGTWQGDPWPERVVS
jgi:hypothetical protein